MPLTQSQKESITLYLPVYRAYRESDEHQKDLEKREERQELYQQLLSPDKIANLKIKSLFTHLFNQ